MMRRSFVFALLLALPVVAAAVVGLGAVATRGPSGVSALLAGPSEAAIGSGGTIGAPVETALSAAIAASTSAPIAPTGGAGAGGGDGGSGTGSPDGNGAPRPRPGTPGPQPPPDDGNNGGGGPPQPPPPQPPPPVCPTPASCPGRTVAETAKPVTEPLPAPLEESIRQTVDGVGRSVDGALAP